MRYLFVCIKYSKKHLLLLDQTNEVGSAVGHVWEMNHDQLMEKLLRQTKVFGIIICAAPGRNEIILFRPVSETDVFVGWLKNGRDRC